MYWFGKAFDAIISKLDYYTFKDCMTHVVWISPCPGQAYQPQRVLAAKRCSSVPSFCGLQTAEVFRLGRQLNTITKIRIHHLVHTK